MVIDFEHHYVPIELARRMGINTETRTIVEEDGVAKANVHVHSSISMRKSRTWIGRGSISLCKLVFWDGIRRSRIAGCSTIVQRKFKKSISGASSAWPIFRR